MYSVRRKYSSGQLAGMSAGNGDRPNDQTCNTGQLHNSKLSVVVLNAEDDLDSSFVVRTSSENATRKCTLWRCKSTPTPKAKLLWMT